MPESNSNQKRTNIPDLMDVTMEKIRDMVDVETIIGDPITVGTDVTIIPISKVSYGFASGGSDLPTKVPKDLFGGGTGAGISIQPVGFLVVQNGDVRLLQMTEGNGDTANNLIRTLPEVISKVSSLVKSKKKPSKSSDDLNTDEEA
ncbi:MAG: spore germination protein GerW family protein [Ruminococcus sp.]|nr:spore germination protein GerW family protein [Ruminococcus sp.]